MPKPLTSVAEHQATVSGLVGLMPVRSTPIADCLGLVLAADLVAPIPLPPFDNSAMDGYAVRAADVVDAPVTLPVAQDIPAGLTDVAPLEAGTAHRIMTGAPVPAGADAVIQVEHTDGRTRFVMLKGGSDHVSEGSDWYFDGGMQHPEFSAKLLLPGLGVDASPSIGFRVCWEEDATWARSTG